MNRLRVDLPKDGWKITKDGMDGTIGNSPQIVAESKKRRVMVDIRLDKEVKSEKAPRHAEGHRPIALLPLAGHPPRHRRNSPPNMWRP